MSWQCNLRLSPNASADVSEIALPVFDALPDLFGLLFAAGEIGVYVGSVAQVVRDYGIYVA
jgi:hypothetical protein